MASHTDSSTFLFNVPPLRMEMVCRIIDSGDASLGWRDLAARILPNWSDMRHTERLEAAGKSPTGELLWSWAQKNKTVGDLLRVLEDMGHHRALDVLRSGDMKPTPREWPSSCEDSSQDRFDSESKPCAVSQGSPLKHSIAYVDVEEGTGHFHPASKIGEGAFSVVYKGRKGDQMFAVKLFKQEKNRSWEKLWMAFRTEMEVLHHKRHPNVLELWGCYLEGDRYCLVTPYLPNGSLSHQLHEEGGVSLSWQDRLSIVKGTARALAYLHSAPPCGVICGNLTSKNILLDDWLQPKLSDFGQAHLRPRPLAQSCTVTLDAGPPGTQGYLPEEYIRHGKLSAAVDVYSLGVVMMETLTGQKPEQQSPKHIQLRETLCRAVEETGGTDVCLSHLDAAAGPWPQDVGLGLFRLALECAASRPKARPGMQQVLEVIMQLLPLPPPPSSESLPRTLEGWYVRPSHSLPEEHDETQCPALSLPPQSGPFECSQSEVTFLSGVSRGAEPRGEADSGGTPDLYCSWPTQCSCAAEDGRDCEDCVSNRFAAAQSLVHGEHGSLRLCDPVQNSAKGRFVDKIRLYNEGQLDTLELFSMKRDSPGEQCSS